MRRTVHLQLVIVGDGLASLERLDALGRSREALLHRDERMYGKRASRAIGGQQHFGPKLAGFGIATSVGNSGASTIM